LDTKSLFWRDIQDIDLSHTGSMKKLLSITITSLSLISCASLPPSVTERDALPAIHTRTTWQAAQQAPSSIVDGLRDVFNDPSLDILIERILTNNLDIQRAYHQMQEAGFAERGQRGDLFPSLSTSLGSTRSDTAGQSITESYSAGLDVTWEVDVWGKIRSQQDSLSATTQARIEGYRAIQDSLAAQGIQVWFDVVSNHQQVSLSRLRLENLDTRKADTSRRYQAGLADYEDLAAIEREIAITQANLQTQIDSLNQSIRQLKVLSGEYPSLALDRQYALPTLLDAPKADLPANIITERPDLRSAWQEVLATDASVKVAHKELYPSLTLSGALTQQSTSLSDLFDGSALWSAAGNAVMPLFNAGKLKNAMLEQQSRAEQAWLDYLIAVQEAFSEVEQTLDRENIYQQRETDLSKALGFAERTEKIAASRYQKGLITILEFLDAQNTRFTVQSDLITARNDRLKNRVSLALALGKGV